MKNISNNKKCDYNNFKRARYFDGELMSKPIFEAEQFYHNEKRRLLNRMLHGWGVVCGLKIKQTDKASSSIIIEKGLALDCAGNEIFVCEPYTLNVAELVNSCTDSKRPSASDECTDEKKTEEKKWYVVIKYKEVPADPVPTYIPSGGCEEKGCEHSRVKEGYCLDLCKTVQCPRKPGEECDPCNDLKEEEEIREFICEKLLLPCTGACCDHPQVVLGSITFTENITSETKIESSMINNWDCRKYVITFSLLQHWISLMAPRKVPLEDIVNYTRFGDACENKENAQKEFEHICHQNTDDQGTDDQNIGESGETSGGNHVMVTNRASLYVFEQPEDESREIRVGQDWELPNSWKLHVYDVDDDNKVKISLSKNSFLILQQEVQKGDMFTFIQGKIPMFMTYVENIEKDGTKFVKLKYTWAVNA